MRINKLKVGNQTISISDEVDIIKSKKVINIIKTKVRSFSKSGAYIPLSQDYNNKEVYVIVLGAGK